MLPETGVSFRCADEKFTRVFDAAEKTCRRNLGDFGGSTVLVRAVPMLLSDTNIADSLREIAGRLLAGRREVTTERMDWIYHSVACRAAVKAGDGSTPAELLSLAERVLYNDDIRTCPHGRPVCFELTSKEIEKQFGRIV